MPVGSPEAKVGLANDGGMTAAWRRRYSDGRTRPRGRSRRETGDGGAGGASGGGPGDARRRPPGRFARAWRPGRSVLEMGSTTRRRSTLRSPSPPWPWKSMEKRLADPTPARLRTRALRCARGTPACRPPRPAAGGKRPLAAGRHGVPAFGSRARAVTAADPDYDRLSLRPPLSAEGRHGGRGHGRAPALLRGRGHGGGGRAPPLFARLQQRGRGTPSRALMARWGRRRTSSSPTRWCWARRVARMGGFQGPDHEMRAFRARGWAPTPSSWTRHEQHLPRPWPERRVVAPVPVEVIG